MKTGPLVVALAAVVVVGGVAFAFMQEVPAETSPDTTAATTAVMDETPSQAVHVDDLTANPDEHTGTVLIQGVVAGVDQKENVFALIDAREFEACGTVACATNYLPVRVTGTLPEPLSLVQVSGEIVTGTKGLEVRADALEAVN